MAPPPTRAPTALANRRPKRRVAVCTAPCDRWLTARSGPQGEQRPAPGDALERLHAAVLEAQPGADDGAERRPRGHVLAGRGHRGPARGDVHRHAADVVADDLALAGVQADADPEAELAHGADDRLGAAQGARRRAVECDQ